MSQLIRRAGSAPLRYGELIAALNATSGERADSQAVREAVLALRARKGMVLDLTDHDTLERGIVLHKPGGHPGCLRTAGR